MPNRGYDTKVSLPLRRMIEQAFSLLNFKSVEDARFEGNGYSLDLDEIITVEFAMKRQESEED